MNLMSPSRLAPWVVDVLRSEEDLMGSISSSTGLISGIDIASLVKQLMQIESRPLTLLQNRITSTQAEQTAYAELNARVMSAMTSVTRLASPSAFTVKTATSSQPEVLSATADSSAPAGSYSFLVRSLVSTHQVVSQGFADRDLSPVGAGMLTVEVGSGQVDPDTDLSALNGGQGVRRGEIRITDRSGASARVDLRSTLTVTEVLDAINSQSDVAVRAYLSDGGIVIEDQTGLTSGALTVANVGGGFTATDLGIAGSDTDADGLITGRDLMYLSGQTRLASLNDGTGVGFNATHSDFKITLADGTEFDIDLTRNVSFDTNLAELNGGLGVGGGPNTMRITNRNGEYADIAVMPTETLGELNARLKGAVTDQGNALNVQISSVSGSGTIVLSDSTGGAGKLKVEDLEGTVAAQFKLAGETEEASVTGQVGYQFGTLDSLIRKIEYARDTNGVLNGGRLQIAISPTNNKQLSIGDASGGPVMVQALNGSQALASLGFEDGASGTNLGSRRLLAGTNTVLLSSLNGGRGVATGPADFALRDGTTRQVDLSGTETLQEVIDRINAVGGLHAEVASGGTGLIVTDTTMGTGSFTASGAVLDDLHLSGTSTNDRLVGGDLNLRYVSDGTLLADLNGGKGVGLDSTKTNSTASFEITTTNATTVTITLNGTSHRTIGDVVNAINDKMAAYNITARINDNGDGIELVDTNGGATKLAVTESSGGSLARKLGLLGTAEEAEPGVLTGGLARSVEITAADTLETLVEKINSENLGVTASIINDGSGDRPYRLILTSNSSGRDGEVAFSTGGSSLMFDTLSEARDATLVIGDLDSASAVVLRSSSNTVDDVIKGLTLELTNVSDTPVQVSVTADIESVVSDVSSFIDTYNAVFDRIDELTKYDPETEQRAVLQGESAVWQMRDRLYRAVSRTIADSDLSMRRLSEVGITFEAEGGGRLQVDEEKFREAFADDPDGVRALFTKVTATTDADGEESPVYVGIAAKLNQELKALTNSVDGYLTQQGNRLGGKVEMYNQRAEDMQEMLDRKEARLYAQFQAMESALAGLQSQQSALDSLSNMVSSLSAT